MYELEYLFNSAGFIIYAIIQIVFWVVFFYLAYNVWKMKQVITGREIKFLLDKGKRYDFAGNKQKAIEHYLEYIYFVENQVWADEHKQKLLDKVKKRIKELGGNIPDNPSVF